MDASAGGGRDDVMSPSSAVLTRRAALAALLMGGISDALKGSYGAESLRYAAVGCTFFYLIAALLMLFAAKRLRADWVEEA